jgi:hypothetical protein
VCFEEGLFLLLLLLLLLFLTAVGFSPGGSSLTPVQTPQYNNTYINGTAQIAVHVLAVHPQYSVPTQIQYTYISTIYPLNYNIPTVIQYTYPSTIYPYNYNTPTLIQYTCTRTVYLYNYNIPMMMKLNRL